MPRWLAPWPSCRSSAGSTNEVMSAIEHRQLQRQPSPAMESRDNTARSHPLGATPAAGGVNFSVFSRSASAIELLLFDRMDPRPSRVIRIDPESTARIITGTFLYRACAQVRSTAIVSTDHPIPRAACVLTDPSSCSIPMAVRSWFRTATIVPRRSGAWIPSPQR